MSKQHRFAFVGSLFQQHIQAVPAISASQWALSIGGLVRHPLTFTLDDLQALPSVEWQCVVACAGRGALIGEADWRGVPLEALLAELHISAAAQHVSVYSADGYRASLTLDRLRGALLAYAMDGQPLPAEHGYPARLIVPGQYGYKMPKWVTHIRLGDTPAPGFWERRGWPEAAPVRPLASVREARADANGDIHIAGVAYAGEQRIAGVDLNLDDSGWTPSLVTPGVAHGWTHWQTVWTPGEPVSGRDVVLRARAHDLAGNIQPDPDTVILRISQERA